MKFFKNVHKLFDFSNVKSPRKTQFCILRKGRETKTVIDMEFIKGAVYFMFLTNTEI